MDNSDEVLEFKCGQCCKDIKWSLIKVSEFILYVKEIIQYLF